MSESRPGVPMVVVVWVLVGLLPVAFAPGAGWPVQPLGAQELDRESRAIRLLDRATWGVRPEDVRLVLEMGEARWLEWQLHPDTIDDEVLDARLLENPVIHASVAELYANFPPTNGPELQPLRDSLAMADSLPERTVARLRSELAERGPNGIIQELTRARLERAVHSRRQLEGVMTEFWFDHFNVFWGKGADRWLTGRFEEDAIRPHVFGKFGDMLKATARHPAMLFYLDNWRSSRPGRGSGINENYARELLELHTLGVDGGYSQEDVRQVALAFTGWTVVPPGRRRGTGADSRGMGMDSGGSPAAEPEPWAFQFAEARHDSEDKVVLGHSVKGGRGEAEGLEILSLLARHPATARHLARKLAERFVSDDPQEALVELLAQVYLETDGDLRAVTRALFTSDEFYEPGSPGNRTKSPLLLAASALRVTGGTVDRVPPFQRFFRELDGSPYLAEAPVGYPEASETWNSPGAMVTRVNFGLDFGEGRFRGARPDPNRLRSLSSDPEGPEEGLRSLIVGLRPGIDPDRLLAIVEASLTADPPGGPGERRARAAGIVLASPEFQRH